MTSELLNTVLFESPEALDSKLAIIKEMIAQDKYVIHPEHIANQLLQYQESEQYAPA